METEGSVKMEEDILWLKTSRDNKVGTTKDHSKIFRSRLAAVFSAGATWLSILSNLILCVAPARLLNRDKKIGGSGQQVQEKYLIKSR